MKNLFQEALEVVITYLETALAKGSFVPEASPTWALECIGEVYERALRMRTTNPVCKPDEYLGHGYVRALWYLYPFVEGKETPLTLLAACRFLNLLGSECRAMNTEERGLGQEVMQTLQMLQNPEPVKVIASFIYAKLGIPLGV